MILEPLIVPESKEVIKKKNNDICQKDAEAQLKGFTLAKSGQYENQNQ